MTKATPNGQQKTVEDTRYVYYDGYWIRYYAPPPNSLAAKKHLIDSLTRRLFHHTEPGINTPGEKLDIARQAYERETDPARKRVVGAMLAGALFNRATDIFTTVVELAEKGVNISLSNELMRHCGEYFQEALELGKLVKHHSGQEGIDELWGEPFKVFTLPIEEFYQSRYIKVAQTMRDIDRIAHCLREVFGSQPAFAGVEPLIEAYRDAAKREAEIVRSDPEIFDIWPRFVATGEALMDFEPKGDAFCDPGLGEGVQLLREGKDLMGYLAAVRVPMPKSTQDYLARCEDYRRRQNLRYPLDAKEGTSY